MAVIYLKHPEHGVKVACLDLEADADVENGWERFDPEQVTPQVDNAIVRRRSRNMKVDNEEAVSSSPIADLSK
jgi:hypothetical protein